MKLPLIKEDKNIRSILLYKSKDGNFVRYAITYNDSVDIYEKFKNLNYKSVVHLRKVDILNLFDTLKE
jgi:hypothetical protein